MRYDLFDGFLRAAFCRFVGATTTKSARSHVNDGLFRRSAPRLSAALLAAAATFRRSLVRRSHRIVTGISAVSRFNVWKRRVAPRFTTISTPFLLGVVLRDGDADFTAMFRVVIGTTAPILESENQCFF